MSELHAFTIYGEHDDLRAREWEVEAPDSESAALCWGAVFGKMQMTGSLRHQLRVYGSPSQPAPDNFAVCRNLMGVSIEKGGR